ncbi:MAG: FAD-dependent oxidoreductase [Firmicutes bacterium]|nr:FAD-dependent oxidoreductase [Bacillota bacterium]
MSSLDYKQLSYWLMTAQDSLDPRPSLTGHADVDVAIVGAGFTGLWTAYHLLQHAPDIKVAVVDKDIAGYGASGRNGGWCTAELPVSHGVLAERFGAEQAQAIQHALFGVIDQIHNVTRREGIDCEWEKAGALMVVMGPEQQESAHHLLREAAVLGLSDHFAWLSAEETRQRVNIPHAVGAVYTPDCASIHPGKLVRGLAHAVERRGGQIFEETPVTEVLRQASRWRLATPSGSLDADAVILATEAYLSQFPQYRRYVLPVRSSIILTAPLTPAQWEQIGWKRRLGLASFRYTVDYLNRTADGRILFGGRGAPYEYGSRIRPGSAVQPETRTFLVQQLRHWFPQLGDVAIDYAWEGVLGMPRDWIPRITFDADTRLGWAFGYTGQGVAMSYVAGYLLSHLILGLSDADPLVRALQPWLNRPPQLWEPEPLRFVGVRYTQRALRLLDAEAARSGRAPSGRSLAERLARH